MVDRFLVLVTALLGERERDTVIHGFSPVVAHFCSRPPARRYSTDKTKLPGGACKTPNSPATGHGDLALHTCTCSPTSPSADCVRAGMPFPSKVPRKKKKKKTPSEPSPNARLEPFAPHVKIGCNRRRTPFSGGSLHGGAAGDFVQRLGCSKGRSNDRHMHPFVFIYVRTIKRQTST